MSSVKRWVPCRRQPGMQCQGHNDCDRLYDVKLRTDPFYVRMREARPDAYRTRFELEGERAGDA